MEQRIKEVVLLNFTLANRGFDFGLLTGVAMTQGQLHYQKANPGIGGVLGKPQSWATLHYLQACQPVRQNLFSKEFVSACVNLRKALGIPVSFRNFLRLLSFVYFLSLKKPSSIFKEGTFQYRGNNYKKTPPHLLVLTFLMYPHLQRTMNLEGGDMAVW
jgi:hypothetical protein